MKMDSKKSTVLVAYDNKKKELIEWVKKNEIAFMPKEQGVDLLIRKQL